MNQSPASNPIRAGVIGLGAMGRHHARVLDMIPEAEFVGACDPAGDHHRAVRGLPVFESLDELLALGIEAAVVAVPSSDHPHTAAALAAAGVHTLVEKPLASSTGEAQLIVDAFSGTDLVAGVGHVERFNAATRQLKARLDAGLIGSIIAVSTERVGPFPLRVRDVGVIKDLATHDLDLLRHVAGPIDRLHGQVAHKLDRPYEDLVEAVGRSESGIVLRMSVNWLTPAKRRSITVLGERGALVADLLNADLTHYANSAVPIEWDEMKRLRGVAEGDVTRFAFSKPEPLAVELTQFCRTVRGCDEAMVVSLADGLAVVELADQLEDNGG